MLGNALLIEGTLLRPGVYTGLDGVPTRYDAEFIRKVKANLVGQPIKFAHAISPESMTPEIPKGEGVGYWTAVHKNGVIRVRGYVFNPTAIAYAKRHPNVGLSMEADVTTRPDSDGGEVATDGMLTGGVLIDDPACSACRVEIAREVNLQSEENVSENMSETNTAEAFIQYTRDENLAKPTRESFFNWVEDQMKKAGVPDDVIPKAIAVLKKAIKVPYPYPYPKAQEFLEAEYGKDLAVYITEMLSKYTDWIKQCVKGGKTMGECAGMWKEKYPSPEEKKAEASEVEKNVEMLMKELAERRAAEAKQLDEDINKTLTEIKALEKDFDQEKFLEGVTCKKLQRKMLGKYLEVLKRTTKPIRLQVADSQKETLVKDTVKSMFGEGATFESIFELPKTKESGK